MTPARKRPAPAPRLRPNGPVAPLTFTLEGPPQPKQRARIVRTEAGKVARYTPKETKRYEHAVKMAGWAAVCRYNASTGGWSDAGGGYVDVTPRLLWKKDGRYRVEVFAYFGDARRRDADNVGKAVTDALNGALYEDDSQIATLIVHRAIDRERPRTEVRVEVLP